MPRVAPLIELDSIVRKELRRLLEAPSTSQAVAQRASIVLLAARGHSNQEIAAHLRVTPNTVTKWRKRFQMFGPEGLDNWSQRGRPRKYGPEVSRKLRRLLRRPAPNGGEHWTLDELSEHLKVPRSTIHDMLVAGESSSRYQPIRRRRR